MLLWSVANEPASEEAAAEPYLAAVLNATRGLDPQRRPITLFVNSEACFNAELNDFIDGRLYTPCHFDFALLRTCVCLGLVQNHFSGIMHFIFSLFW